MTTLSDIVKFESGTPQSRIIEDFSGVGPAYFFYTQSEIEEDLVGLDLRRDNRKIRTFDRVHTVTAGDVVFSLISGKAAIVQANHSGYLLTQNYIKLVPTYGIDTTYLVYMINEDRNIRQQLQSGQQGSATIKHTIRQLSALIFPSLPPMEKQKALGELYFCQMRLCALRKRIAELETTLVLEKIKEANRL